MAKKIYCELSYARISPLRIWINPGYLGLSLYLKITQREEVMFEIKKKEWEIPVGSALIQYVWYPYKKRGLEHGEIVEGLWRVQFIGPLWPQKERQQYRHTDSLLLDLHFLERWEDFTVIKNHLVCCIWSKQSWKTNTSTQLSINKYSIFKNMILIK